MKYTLEDFKNKKIAVWVENEEEYRKFCEFAKGLKWNDGDLIQNYIPQTPCEIAFGFMSEFGLSLSHSRRGRSHDRPGKYKSVTIDELKIKQTKPKIKEIRHFNSFRLDLPHGIFRIDNVDVSTGTIKEFKLEFKDGRWTMDYKIGIVGSCETKKSPTPIGD